MSRLGIVTSDSPSLKTVAGDIATVFSELGVQSRVYTRQIPFYEAKTLFDRSIVFMPFDPTYVLTYILLYRDYRNHGITSAFYTTVEGKPVRTMIPKWVRRDVEAIAVSNYVKERLEYADINVVDVIPHGVDLQLTSKVSPDNERLKRLTGGSMVFGAVASGHRRKGLDLLAKAIEQVNSKIDAGFYVLTEPKAEPLFAKCGNTYVDTRFGKLSRLEVLNLISSFNFYVCSSLSEGFGLPLLESQAFGIPVVYPDYPPLNEFIDSRINFPYQYRDVEEYRDVFGIAFEFHIYRVEDLAGAIMEAYNVYATDSEKYHVMSEEARRQIAEKYDIRHVYHAFKRHINL